METQSRQIQDRGTREVCPKGLSRWKGMETSSYRTYRYAVSKIVRKDFPGGREWKLFYSSIYSSLAPFAGVRKDFPGGREWKLCSRACNITFLHRSESERTFPVEGNGNEHIPDRSAPTIRVRKDFPGGREWKLLLPWFRLWLFSFFCLVRKDFPGGREWKRFFAIVIVW